MKELTTDPFFDEQTGYFNLNGRTFKLDPDEQEESDELDQLNAAGLLKSTLTPARRKELQQAARNTLELLRQGRRDLIEYSEEPVLTTTNSVAALLNQRKIADRQHTSPSFKKHIAAVA